MESSVFLSDFLLATEGTENLKKKMSNVTDIISKFDFCDGQIESVFLDGDIAELCFNSWKEKKYKFIFKDVVYFKCYNFGLDVSEVEIVNQTQEINEAVEEIKSGGGKAEGYNDFNFYQINFEGCYGPDCIIIFLDLEMEEL